MKPKTIGERIRFYRMQLGINQAELAKRCAEFDLREKPRRWGQSRIGNFETGFRMPLIEDIPILSKALNIAPDKLAFDENVSVINIASHFSYPLLSNIQAGAFSDTFDFNDSEGYEMFSSNIRTKGQAFYLKITGDSMLPKFVEGDLVLIDTGKNPHPGDFVAAVNGDGQATFKQYKELGDLSFNGTPHFELIPLNSLYPTLSTLKKDIRIIGVAVEHRNFL